MSIAEPLSVDEPMTLTWADVLEELGDVPPWRIISRPAPGTATEDDVLRLMESPRKRLCELIEGVLVEKAMGFRESMLAVRLAVILDAFVRPRKLGIVVGSDGAMRLWPGRVRIPDVSFLSWERLPGRTVSTQPIPDVFPDIAIEVLSESNTKKEMEKKRDDYFRVGVRLVWEVDPEGRTIRVYTSIGEPTGLSGPDILDGGSVLPGFTLPLPELFGELDEQG